MKILLSTPFPYRMATPLGLGYLAVSLRRAGHDVQIRNAIVGKDDPGEFAAWCRKTAFDMVGLQVMTPVRGAARNILQALQEHHPKALRVVGGPHVTARGDKVFEDFPEAHYAFCGEAEHSLPELLGMLGRDHRPRPGKKLANVPGLVYRAETGARQNPTVLVEDLDSLGPLPWDLFDIETYNRDPGILKVRQPWYWIMSSRGCINSCTYCLIPKLHQGRIRYHSPKYVVDEMETMKRLGIPSISLADDFPTADRKHFIELCLEIERRGLDLDWDLLGNGTRLDSLDEELLKIMERSGCKRLQVSVESGSSHMLDKFRRNYDPRHAVDHINKLASATKIDFTVFFMLGYPDETDLDVLHSFKAAMALKTDHLHINLFSPWPGTPITRRLEREGRLPELPDEAYYFDTPAMPTKTISKRRLRLYGFLFNVAYYSRPSRIYKLIRDETAQRVFVGTLHTLWLILRDFLKEKN